MFYVTVKYEITTLLSSHDNWGNPNTFKWTAWHSVSIAYQHQLNTSRDINWSLIKTCLFTDSLLFILQEKWHEMTIYAKGRAGTEEIYLKFSALLF